MLIGKIQFTPFYGYKILVILLTLVASLTVSTTFSEIVSPPECTDWPGARWQPGPKQFGVQVESNVKVRMSDGVVLNAKIGYPTNHISGERMEGRFPVLLSQNPYLGLGLVDSYFVRRGYIYVVVEVRGTGNSSAPESAPLPNTLFSKRQAEDGVELVHWVEQLEGSNGDVGLIGCSQLGINQIFTAAQIGPNSSIKAILPACSAHGYSSHFVGGIAGNTVPLMGVPILNFIQGFRNFKANAHWTGELHENINSGRDEAYNREFWQERSTARVAKQVVDNGIPALLWSGWNANEGWESLKLYAMFQNAWAKRSPFNAMLEDQQTTGRYQIVLGPWGHAGGLNKGIQLAWFDTWLKGQNTGMDKTPTPMHLYELNGMRWVNAETLPLTHQYTTYYLSGDGQLTPFQAAGEGSDRLIWQRPEAGAALNYKTAPFDTDMTLAGPIAATVFASSSNSNLSLVAALYDVAPDGTRERISSGALLGSLRANDQDKSWVINEIPGQPVIKPYHPFDVEEYLTPNSIERFDVEMTATLWRIAKGHTLEIELTSQARTEYCKLAVNNLLGVSSPCKFTDHQVSTLQDGIYQIQRTGLHASVVNLPLVEPESLQSAVRPNPDSNRNKNQSLDWGSNPDYCR